MRARFNLSDFDTGLADLNARLKGVGEVVSTLPSPASTAEGGISFNLLLGTGLELAQIEEVVKGLPAEVVRLGTKEAPRKSGAALRRSATTEAAAAAERASAPKSSPFAR